MPLLSTFLDGMNSSNKMSASVRYCDSNLRRHMSSGNTCAFASPTITSLVPEDQKYTRVRDGFECNHFSFNAIRGASLQARVLKRFESIENDRQENMIDILNNINEKSGESSDLLRKIVSKFDSDGTACHLLKTIAVAFSTGGAFDEMVRNTTFTAQYMRDMVIENQKLNEDLKRYHLEDRSIFQNAFKNLIQLNSDGLESWQQMVKTGDEICTKTDSFTKFVNNQSKSLPNIESNIQEISAQLKRGLNINGLKELREKINTQETELSSVKNKLQIIGAVFQTQGLEMERELNEIKRGMNDIKNEFTLLREAITDILPNKLIDAFKLMTDHYSYDGSDEELVNSQRTDPEDPPIIIFNSNQINTF